MTLSIGRRVVLSQYGNNREDTGPGDDKSFRPYAVGYVELPGQIIVESHIATSDFDALKIGQPMRLVIVPYSVSADGTQVMTFAFAPAGEESPARAAAREA